MTLAICILLAQTAPAIDFDHKGAPVTRVVAAMACEFGQERPACGDDSGVRVVGWVVLRNCLGWQRVEVSIAEVALGDEVRDLVEQRVAVDQRADEHRFILAVDDRPVQRLVHDWRHPSE